MLYLKYIQFPRRITFYSQIPKSVQSFIFLFIIRGFLLSKDQFVLLKTWADGLCCRNVAGAGKYGFVKTQQYGFTAVVVFGLSFIEREIN